jgi:aspartate/methionine/tyrosine aminotransferase
MHAGMMMPLPTQQAVIAALGDYEHVKLEKEIYRKRRDVLLNAVKKYGFELSDSEAGLYLWATLGEDCWATVEKMAKLGIVVVPGSFYGEYATKHVRFSLTASDSDIARAAARLENALG